MNNKTSREEKIEALRDFQAGRISRDQLPKPEIENTSCWHYDGNVYIRVDPKNGHVPYPSGECLSENDYFKFVLRNPRMLNTILDSTGNMEWGDMQAEEFTEDDGAGLSGVLPQLRIGVILPLGWLVPVKASKWKEFGFDL